MVPVPPVAVVVRVSEVPEQTGGEFEPILLIVTGLAGWETVCVVVTVQPLTSVMVMVYDPVVRLVKIPVDAPVVFTVGPAITKLYGDVPPLPEAVIVPVLPPLHKTAVKELFAVNAVGCAIVCDVVTVQPLASVTVMV